MSFQTLISNISHNVIVDDKSAAPFKPFVLTNEQVDVLLEIYFNQLTVITAARQTGLSSLLTAYMIAHSLDTNVWSQHIIYFSGNSSDSLDRFLNMSTYHIKQIPFAYYNAPNGIGVSITKGTYPSSITTIEFVEYQTPWEASYPHLAILDDVDMFAEAGIDLYNELFNIMPDKVIMGSVPHGNSELYRIAQTSNTFQQTYLRHPIQTVPDINSDYLDPIEAYDRAMGIFH